MAAAPITYPVWAGGTVIVLAGSTWRSLGSWYTALRVLVNMENCSDLIRPEKSLLVTTNSTASSMSPEHESKYQNMSVV